MEWIHLDPAKHAEQLAGSTRGANQLRRLLRNQQRHGNDQLGQHPLHQHQRRSQLELFKRLLRQRRRFVHIRLQQSHRHDPGRHAAADHRLRPAHRLITQETMLFASADNGVHWTRRSTIASYTADPSVGMASEGPSESSLVQLNNGSLLSVFRTGQPFPGYDVNATQPTLMWAMSGDNGSTWTTPKMLGVGGAFPLLHKLDDGAVALTYGRYGAKVMLVDPTGLRWTTPTVIYNGPGSGYVDMKELPNGNFCFVYDQSSFYPPSWNGSVPSQYVYNNDQSGNLKSAILSIQQQASTDDYHWASEYHGDVSPDTLATPWSKVQSGTTNQYLWADQGQDYLRIDTTATSNAATLNYSLPASNTPWQGISFSKGAVIDLRAARDRAERRKALRMCSWVTA